MRGMRDGSFALAIMLGVAVAIVAGCGGQDAVTGPAVAEPGLAAHYHHFAQLPGLAELPRAASDIRTLDPSQPAEDDGVPLMSAGVQLGYPTTAQPGEVACEWVIYQCDPISDGVVASGVRMGLSECRGSVWLGRADYQSGIWDWQELKDFPEYKKTIWFDDAHYRGDGVAFIALVVMPGSYLELSELDLPKLWESDLEPEVLGVGPLEFTAGNEVQFQAEYTGSRPLSFSWDFGGYATPWQSSAAKPLVQVDLAGSHNGSVTISSAYGESTFEFTYTVLYADIAPEIVSVWPRGGGPGEIVQLVAQMAGGEPVDWDWDFGGGAVPNQTTGESPTVELGAEGYYTCTLNVSNQFGSDQIEFWLNVGKFYVDDDGIPDNDPADLGVISTELDGGFMVELNFKVSNGTLPYVFFELDSDFTPPEANFWDDPDTIYDLKDFGAGWTWTDNGGGFFTATGPVYQPEGYYSFAIRVVDSLAESQIYWWPDKVLLESPGIFKESWEDRIQPGAPGSQWQLEGETGIYEHDWINTGSNRALAAGALGSTRFARFDSADFGGSRWQYGNDVSRALVTGPHTCEPGQEYNIILHTAGFSEGVSYDYLTIEYSWGGTQWWPFTDGAENYFGSYRFARESLGDTDWLGHQQLVTAMGDEFLLRIEFISDDNSDAYDGPCIDEIKVLTVP